MLSKIPAIPRVMVGGGAFRCALMELTEDNQNKIRKITFYSVSICARPMHCNEGVRNPRPPPAARRPPPAARRPPPAEANKVRGIMTWN
jgi:hypothetical protein